MFRSPLADGVILLLIILLFVGPKRLPMLSRSIGESIKEFKGGIGDQSDDKKLDPAPPTPATQPAQPAPTSGSADKRDTIA
jgi:sec-independent protein translocase protein TatA